MVTSVFGQVAFVTAVGGFAIRLFVMEIFFGVTRIYACITLVFAGKMSGFGFDVGMLGARFAIGVFIFGAVGRGSLIEIAAVCLQFADVANVILIGFAIVFFFVVAGGSEAGSRNVTAGFFFYFAVQAGIGGGAGAGVVIMFLCGVAAASGIAFRFVVLGAGASRIGSGAFSVFIKFAVFFIAAGYAVALRISVQGASFVFVGGAAGVIVGIVIFGGLAGVDAGVALVFAVHIIRRRL